MVQSACPSQGMTVGTLAHSCIKAVSESMGIKASTSTHELLTGMDVCLNCCLTVVMEFLLLLRRGSALKAVQILVCRLLRGGLKRSSIEDKTKKSGPKLQQEPHLNKEALTYQTSRR